METEPRSFLILMKMSLFARRWIIFCPPNSYVEALTPRVTILEHRAYKEVIKFKMRFNSRMRPWSDRISIFIRRAAKEASVPSSLSFSPTMYITKERPWEDIWRRQLSSSQEEQSHQNTNQLESWFWPSIRKNYEKINLFKPPTLSVLSWQQEGTSFNH